MAPPDGRRAPVGYWPVAELLDGGYRLTAQQLIPIDPPALLPWLCSPDLMKRWIPHLEDVDLIEGEPCTAGARMAIRLCTRSRYGSLNERYRARIDEIGPTWLVRTYWWAEGGVDSYNFTSDTYVRTVAYDLSPGPSGTQLDCEVLTMGVETPPSAAYMVGRYQKALSDSLEDLSRLCHGRRRALRRRLAVPFTGGPPPQPL